MLGPHLTLDLYGCNKEKLFDVEFVEKLLDKIPDMIGMHKISKPFIIPYPGKPGSFDQGGISAVILIAESHISCHTWIAQEYASIDIFSCKQFDVERTIELFTKAFEAKKVEKRMMTRGREFPKEIPKVVPIIRRQRKTLE